MVLPATPVAAPDAGLEWVESVDGTRFDRYFTWQMLANRLTLTAHPVVVTSAGFTTDGLPVGVQVVGRHGRELQLLAVTRAIEEATGWIARAPSFDDAPRTWARRGQPVKTVDERRSYQ